MMFSQKTAKQIQKYTFIAAFAVSVLFLVYSLIFSTDIFPLRRFADASEAEYASGAEMYFAAQGFNKMLLGLSVIMLVLAIVPYIFFSPSRRLFYLSNYISGAAFAGFALFMSVFTFLNVIGLRAMYVKVDFATYKDLAMLFSERYVKSTFMFDIGIVLCVVTLLVCAAIIFVLVSKLRLKKSEAIKEAVQ